MEDYFVFDPQAADCSLRSVHGNAAGCTRDVDHWEYWLFEPRVQATAAHHDRWGVLRGDTALDVERQLREAQDLETFSCAYDHIPVGTLDHTHFNATGPIAVSRAPGDGSSRAGRFVALRRSLQDATGLFARLSKVGSNDKQALADEVLAPYASALIAVVRRVNRMQYMMESYLDHELGSIEQAMQRMDEGARVDLLTKLHSLGSDMARLNKVEASESRVTSERLLSML